jgi:hydrogenase maturation protein HypF
VTQPGFEGRAGMLLESRSGDLNVAPYPLPLSAVSDEARMHRSVTPRYWLDPSPLIQNIVADVRNGVGPAAIATRFHATLAALVTEVASRLGAQCVVLSGGCFQNRRLLEGCVTFVLWLVLGRHTVFLCAARC